MTSQTVDAILEERRAEREAQTTLHDTYERMRATNPNLTPAQFRLLLSATTRPPVVEPLRRAVDVLRGPPTLPAPVVPRPPTQAEAVGWQAGRETAALPPPVPRTAEPAFGGATMGPAPGYEVPVSQRPPQAPLPERLMQGMVQGVFGPRQGLLDLRGAYEAARAQNPSLSVQQFQAQIMAARPDLPYGAERGPAVLAPTALRTGGAPVQILERHMAVTPPAAPPPRGATPQEMLAAASIPLVPGPVREAAGRIPVVGPGLERSLESITPVTAPFFAIPGAALPMAAGTLAAGQGGELARRAGLPPIVGEVPAFIAGAGAPGLIRGGVEMAAPVERWAARGMQRLTEPLPEELGVFPGARGEPLIDFYRAGGMGPPPGPALVRAAPPQVTGLEAIVRPTETAGIPFPGRGPQITPAEITPRRPITWAELNPNEQVFVNRYQRLPDTLSAYQLVDEQTAAAMRGALELPARPTPATMPRAARARVVVPPAADVVPAPLGQPPAALPAVEEPVVPSLSQAARDLGITKDALSEYEDRAVYRLTEGKTVMGSGQQGLLVTPIGRQHAVINALVREWGATAGSLRRLAVAHEADLQWGGILRNQAYTAAAQSFGKRLWQPAGTIREFAGAGGDAPAWLRGSLSDIVERADTTYAGVLSKPEAQAIKSLMEYQNADLRTLQARGISVGTWNENYVRHAYAGWLDRNGLLREGMDMGGATILGTRRGPTIYEWWNRTRNGSAVWENPKTGATGWFPLEGQALKVGDAVERGTITRIITEPMKPDSLNFGELLMSRFEQAANLRATKDLLDAAAPAARDGELVKIGGWRGVQGLPGHVGDMPITVRGVTIPASRAVWRTEVADSLQKMLVGTTDPAVLKGVMAVRDVILNLDWSMFTLIGTRYPLAHPIDWIRNFKDWAGVIVSPTARREWIATSQDVRWFVRNGGSLFQKYEYTTIGPNAGKMATEFIPGLKAFNDAAYEGAINFGAVRSAKLNYDVLKAIKGGMRMLGFGEGEGPAITKIPPWQIAQMTDKELSEHAVRSAMDAFAKVNPAEMHLAAGAWERATILTPRFLRAHVALLGKTPTALMGDPEGILNTWFLMQYVAGAAGLAEAISRVSGQHTSLDPRDVNFLAMRVPGGWFSSAGQIRTLMRLFANTPGDIAAGYYDRLAGMAVSRLNWPLSVAYQQVRGAQMFGQPLKGVPDRALFMVTSVLPIVAQGVIDEQTRPTLGSWQASLAFEWLGGAYWPAPLRESLDRISQEDNGVDWDAATPAEHQLSLANHPDVVKLADDQFKEALSRNQPWALLERDERNATDKYNADLDTAYLELVGAAGTPETRARFVEYARGRKDTYLQELATIEARPEYRQVMEGRQQRVAENPTLNRVQELFRAYGEAVRPYEGVTTPDLLEERSAAIDNFFVKMTPQDQLIWQQNTGLYAPEIMKRLREGQTEIGMARSSIDGTPIGYWDIGPALWKRAQADPQLAPFKTYGDYTKSLGYSQEAISAAKAAIPALADYMSKSRGNTTNSMTDSYRRTWPNVDAYLVYWGYTTKFLTDAARTYYKEHLAAPGEAIPGIRGEH